MKAHHYIFIVFALLIGCAGGYHFRDLTKMIDVSTEVVTKKGETVSGYANVHLPSKIELPSIPELPVRYVFLSLDTVQVVDTAAIIADYVLRKTYTEVLFNNNKWGRLEIEPTIQYNKLDTVAWTYTPLYTLKTVTTDRVLVPFIMSSYSSLGYVGVGGGLFYRRLGLYGQWYTSLSSNSWGIGVIYKL